MERFKFPEASVECQAGDYLTVESGGQWTIYKVDDVVLFSRLIPMRFPSGTEWMEEKHLLDSRLPAYAGQIFLLLSTYERRFPSAEEATRAIRGRATGDGRHGYYADVGTFPRSRTRVISPAAP